MESYNGAIKSLIHRQVNSERSIYVSLTSCILFVCLEFLRGDMCAAFSHIRSGKRILESVQEDREEKSCSSTMSRFTSSEQELMIELSSLFERLDLHALLFEPLWSPNFRGTPTFQDESASSQLSFTSFIDAKSRSYELSTEAMAFLLSTTHLKYDAKAATLEHVICQVRLEARFKQWRQAFDQLFSVQQQKWDMHERKAAKIILVQVMTMQIWIATCLFPTETVFDRFRLQFEKIIDLAAEIIGDGAQELYHFIGSFQFDMGIIASLHFIGSKCRFQLLRRKTLKILGSIHWREGLFDSYRSYRCLHLLMQVEEGRLRPDLEPATLDFDKFACSLPLEHARIHVAELAPPPLQADEQALTLVTKPNGIFGPSFISKTTIPTSGDLPLLERWYTWSP